MSLLVTLLFSAVPGFAQTHVGNLGALGPTGLAIGTVGGSTFLYVAEFNGGKIIAYNLTTGSTTPVVVGPASGTFTNPNGVLVDAAGDLFITDRAQNRVVRMTNAGTVVWTYGSAGSGAGQFQGPIGIGRDSTGAVYVTEHDGARVQKFTVGASGLVPVTTGWPVTGFDTAAYTVLADSSNNVFVGDRSGTIKKFSSAGAPMVAGNISVGRIVTGLSLGASGAMYSSQTQGATGNRIQRFPSGSATADLTWGSDGTGNGQFNTAFNVVVNTATNRAYVADFANDRVQIFDLNPPPAGDTTAPTVAVTAGATSATTATFNVAFNENVTGVTNTVFTASGSGGVTASALTAGSVTGSGANYVVTVGYTGSGGSVALSLNATANTSVRDASNNFYAGGATAGGSVTASATIPAAGGGGPAPTTAPRVNSFTLNGAATTATAGAWRITFSEAVTGVDLTDFVGNAGSGATMTLTSVTPVSTSVYDVNFTWAAPGGTGYLQAAIRSSGTGITGASGAFRGEGAAATEVQGTGVSFDAPTITSFTAGTPTATTVTLSLTFSEAVTGLSAADFLVNPAGPTVGTPTGSGTTYSIPVTFSGTGTFNVTLIGGATSDIRDASTYWFAGGTTNATASFTAGGGGGGTAPTIAAQSTSGTVGTAMTYQVVATGATSFSTTSTLPAGLSLSSAGVISGTPTAATPTGGTVVNVTATNATGSNSAAVTITIAAAPPAGSAPTIAAQSTSGTVGTAMTYQVVATGATSFSTTSTLPAGLSLSTAGVISGTPTAATPTGGTVVNVRATNANGSNSAAVTITIAAAPPAGSAPTIANQTVTRTQNAAFSYQVVATGATSFSIVGTPALPAGLSMSSSGLITGIPTATGTTNVTVRATNSTGSTNATLTITINPATPTADTTAPTVVSFVKSSNTASTVTFTVAFSEAVTGVNSTDFSVVTGGTLSASIPTTGVSGSGTTYNIVANYSSTGTLYLMLNSGGSGIADAAGNVLVSGAASGMFDNRPSTPTPPPSGGGGGGGGIVFFPPPVVTTPPVVKTDQTVTFVSPVSSLLVNQGVALSATASSGLPVTFTIVTGNATLSGNTVTLHDTRPVVIRASQDGSATVNAASTDVTLTAQRTAQRLNAPAISNRLTSDKIIQLSATSSSGLPISYTLVSGPATLSGNTLTLTGRPGEVVVNVTQGGNDSFFPATSQLRISVDPAARLVNLSSRMNVTSDQPVIVGFVVSGTTEKQVLVRAVGPGLAAFGVNGALANPRLQLFDGNGLMVTENDDWSGSDVTTVGDGVGAFRLTASSRDAAVVARLGPGAYTAVVNGVNSNGVVLIEVYDAATREQIATQQLVNISTRGFVGTGEGNLIAGFVVTGSEPKRILVRGIGPGLAAFGVAGAITDPSLRIFAAGNETALAMNDNWSTPVTLDATIEAATAADISAAGLATGAFPMAAGSADSAIVITLAPGNYSAVMSGANNITGTGLIEVYEIPNP